MAIMNQVSRRQCYLLEACCRGMEEKKTPEARSRRLRVCVVWAFGGPMIDRQSRRTRGEVQDDFKQTPSTSEYPRRATSSTTSTTSDNQHVHWSDQGGHRCPISALGPGDALRGAHRGDGRHVRMTPSLIDLLARGRTTMLVGTAGTGKTPSSTST